MTDSQGPRLVEPLRELQRELGKLLETTIEPLQGFLAVRSFAAVDLYDSGDRFIIRAELPGLEPDEIDIEVAGDLVRLRGERRRPEGVEPHSYRIHERRFGPWERAIPMPERVDNTTASASFSQGVLTLVLPKAQETAKTRRIVVSAAATATEP
jgi:HSP20 family protein